MIDEWFELYYNEINDEWLKEWKKRRMTNAILLREKQRLNHRCYRGTIGYHRVHSLRSDRLLRLRKVVTKNRTIIIVV